MFFSRFDFCFLLSSLIFFVKRKANSTFEKQKWKGHEKRYQFLVSKGDFFSDIPVDINRNIFFVGNVKKLSVKSNCLLFRSFEIWGGSLYSAVLVFFTQSHLPQIIVGVI